MYPTEIMGKRMLATLYDTLVLSLGIILLTIFVQLCFHTLLVNIFVAITVWLTYYTVMEGAWGQTLGKMTVGIRVVAAETSYTIGYGTAAIRTLCRIVDILPCCYFIGWIFCMATGAQRRARLGDLVASTSVINWQ